MTWDQMALFASRSCAPESPRIAEPEWLSSHERRVCERFRRSHEKRVQKNQNDLNILLGGTNRKPICKSWDSA